MIKLNTNKKKIIRKLEKVNFVGRTNPKDGDKIIFNGNELINLSSNDYLGLSKNPILIKESRKWLEEFGTSLSSSRLISGNLDKIDTIEQLISKFSRNDKTIIMGSGFLLNSTMIPALTGNSLGQRKKTLIFSDKFNHSSINYGCQLTKQRTFRYSHLDLNHLEYLLKKSQKNVQKIIISETVFSMDGDLVNIKDLRFLSKKYSTILYLDEAHALGVFGDTGFGIASDKNKNDNEVIVGTFSKSFGSYGAFVSSSREIVEKITNSCGGLIYSTVLPPSTLGSINGAVKIIPKLSNMRKKILSNSHFLINELKKIKINTGNSSSQIVPLILGDIDKCTSLKNYLNANGFFTKVIRSPTVPLGAERIRLSLTSTMSKKVLEKLIELISRSEIL